MTYTYDGPNGIAVVRRTDNGVWSVTFRGSLFVAVDEAEARKMAAFYAGSSQIGLTL